MRRYVLVTLLMAAATALAAGCGGSASSGSAGGTTTAGSDTTATTAAASGTLSGTVGPGFDISMGVSEAAAGEYTLTVDDRSAMHNFHLTGPGGGCEDGRERDRQEDLHDRAAAGQVPLPVRPALGLDERNVDRRVTRSCTGPRREGIGTMALNKRRRGDMLRTTALASLVVAGALLAVMPAAAATPTFKGTVGPGFTITMASKPKSAGKDQARRRRQVEHSQLPPHRAGVNVKTSVGAVGSKTFTVTLKKGTYKFVCDPHASSMHGTFTVK